MATNSNQKNDAAAQAAWRKRRARRRYLELSKDVVAVAALPFILLISPFFRTYHAIKRFRHREKPVPPKKPFEPRSGTQVAQTQSKLLCLPPEIRTMIWRSAVARHPIMLHRVGERLEYQWLELNGPKHVSVITPQTLEDVKKKRETNNGTEGTHLNLLAILQTCQMIYLETSPLLYKANTFAFLHNEVLTDFCSLTLPHHLSSIQTVHLHFRFRQTQEHFIAGAYRQGFPPPWDEYHFRKSTEQLARSMPNLTSLSLFMQGPIIGSYTWGDVTGSLGTLKRRLEHLRFLALRLPQPAPAFDSYFDASNETGETMDRTTRFIFFERRVKDATDRDHDQQPELEEGQLEHEIEDSDTGKNPGWKIGTMYVRNKDGEDGVERRHYAVEIEDEQQVMERW